ncbi:MAG: class I SAM-dependent DNA methyltransferase [Chloroflexi bacterium]|nr:class I SAM-dependent DNA methyltransferase [Chloroflexota bacterium]
MPATLSPQDFVAKWRHATLKERSASQSHFNDLCALLGQPTPTEADSAGRWYTFEAGAGKTTGGQGWADVWKMGYFAWEYKGQDADLGRAYRQLLQYRESLLNPPLLIVCDLQRIVIHTNFTNTVKRVYELALDDLLIPAKLAILHKAFTDPDALRDAKTPEQVTEEAATHFARLAALLRARGEDPHAIAHFLIRLLFCLFAEDASILPNKLFNRLVTKPHRSPAAFTAQVRQLFAAMATGGPFGVEDVPHVDGGLFDDDTALELDADGLRILAEVSGLDWAAIEPSVLGTLFERSLDPGKRSQLGAHYTGKEDILLIVEPVLMAPLRRRWAEVKVKAEAKAKKRDLLAGSKPSPQKTRQLAKIEAELFGLLRGFRAELAAVQVLDAACGSGNFLYIALRQLLDLEQEVINLAATLGDSRALPMVSPEQLHGIEINLYARELAQATIWIGYIQWFRENGYGIPAEPILRPLEAIQQMDAILDLTGFESDMPTEEHEAPKPVRSREPEWPAANVIIGNPPFLGGKRLRSELGDAYVDGLFKLYDGRVPREADLVCYWFEKARAQIAAGKAKRAGLLATNSIRGGASRRVLEQIKESGDIFMAWSDRPWVLEGAAVRVSMVGFDGGKEAARELDGRPAAMINSNLTAAVDLTQAQRLSENLGLSFMGVTPAGPFDIPAEKAREWMALPLNPNGRPNSDVLRPYFNGMDLTRGSRDVWIIDFGIGTSMEEAALYEAPFEYVVANVKPKRVNQRSTISQWWLHERPRPEMRAALKPLSRYIGTSMVSKHFFFSWIPVEVLPANLLIVVARDDDYFFGVLHSRVHEVWALRMGTSLEDRPRYTPTTTFETFPFPWPPGREPADDPRVQAIAAAAAGLVAKRDAWLNPRQTFEVSETSKVSPARTLTHLYNARPAWLDLAHRALDAAVLAAYGWPVDLSDDDILARLLALNLARARKPTT